MELVTVLISDIDIMKICPKQYGEFITALAVLNLTVADFMADVSEDFLTEKLTDRQLVELEDLGVIRKTYDNLVAAYKTSKGLTLEIYQEQWMVT